MSCVSFVLLPAVVGLGLWLWLVRTSTSSQMAVNNTPQLNQPSLPIPEKITPSDQPKQTRTPPKTSNGGNDKAPELRPTFKVKKEGFVVVLGGHEYSVSQDSSRSSPARIAPFGDARAIQAYIDHGRVYVDANLYYEANKSLKLVHNELRDCPRKWDVNFDKSAIEIVDEKLIPRFQLAYKDDRTVELRGVFQFPSGAVVFEDNARFFWGTLEDKVNITRLFRYPSRLHQGQEVSSQ